MFSLYRIVTCHGLLFLVDVMDTAVVPAYYGHDRRVYSTDPL